MEIKRKMKILECLCEYKGLSVKVEFDWVPGMLTMDLDCNPYLKEWSIATDGHWNVLRTLDMPLTGNEGYGLKQILRILDTVSDEDYSILTGEKVLNDIHKR